MLKYARNLPSPCSPKWKINEADWGSFEKFACSDKNVDDFPTPVHAYDHLLTLSLTVQVNLFQKLLVCLVVQLSLGGTKTVQLPGK